MRASIIAAVFVAGLASGRITVAQRQEAPRLPPERVTGIGGVFFKARDPKALAAWYRETLGVPITDTGTFSLFSWREREDPARTATTVWSLFSADSKYFAPSQAAFMINYRVQNLDRMLAQLRALGVGADSKVAEEFNGRFAWIIDPEGNKIELWEPKAGY